MVNKNLTVFAWSGPGLVQQELPRHAQSFIFNRKGFLVKGVTEAPSTTSVWTKHLPLDKCLVNTTVLLGGRLVLEREEGLRGKLE